MKNGKLVRGRDSANTKACVAYIKQASWILESVLFNENLIKLWSLFYNWH